MDNCITHSSWSILSGFLRLPICEVLLVSCGKTHISARLIWEYIFKISECFSKGQSLEGRWCHTLTIRSQNEVCALGNCPPVWLLVYISDVLRFLSHCFSYKKIYLTNLVYHESLLLSSKTWNKNLCWTLIRLKSGYQPCSRFCTTSLMQSLNFLFTFEQGC